jgi:alkylation response protein AidB-like acyl-CoA dehydrogenase
VDLRETEREATFRAEARRWLERHVVGEFAEVGGRGGPGDEDVGFEVRLAWERLLGKAGWTCLGWPTRWGGRGASLVEQTIWAEEYARAQAPARVGVVGEGLLGPTLIEFGSDAQRCRFLEPIRLGEELWCQGYSEPEAGSDLAGVTTRAVLDGDQWVITGHKVWTSLAHWAQWCFVLCRTDFEAPRHRGLSYLLVPMDQPGVEVRPIRQATGTAEFNEVFFDGARTRADLVVGGVGNGWRVAMATLGYERGVAMLGHVLAFRRQLATALEAARRSGLIDDATFRQRAAAMHAKLAVLRWNVLRSLAGGAVAASLVKLAWSTWHQELCELAMDGQGMRSTVALGGPYELDPLQRAFVFSRAETIFGGTSEIQRNIVGERVLGLPRDETSGASAPVGERG